MTLPNPAAPFEPRPVQGWVGVDPAEPSTLRMAGEVDLLTVTAAGEQLQQRLREVTTVDARELTFMDTMGLHCLVVAMLAARDRGQRVHLVEPTIIVLRVLEITGLTGHFDITHRPHRPQAT